MHTVTIQVFGTTPPCAKCKRAEAEALKASEQFPGRVEVHKLDAMGPGADALGLIVTPTVVVNGRVVGSGRVVPAAELAKHVQASLGE